MCVCVCVLSHAWVDEIFVIININMANVRRCDVRASTSLLGFHPEILCGY